MRPAIVFPSRHPPLDGRLMLQQAIRVVIFTLLALAVAIGVGIGIAYHLIKLVMFTLLALAIAAGIGVAYFSLRYHGSPHR